jgi:uncharacterized repeat protein (TIGR03803 family)
MTTNFVLNTVVSFSGTNGSGPQGPLVQGTDGNLYGTTQLGGADGYGTVFSVSPAGTNLLILATFNQTDGAYPNGGLALGTDGNLYGTTAQGGAGGAGTVFRLWTVLNCSLIGNQFIISWSTNAVGFTLQSSTNLVSPAVWTTVLPPPVVNGQNTVTNTVSSGNEFYRLINADP